MRKKVVCTNNREIYEKFNLLNVSSEIVLKNVSLAHVERMLKSINKGNKVLETERAGGYVVVKKVNPINFSIYHR